MQGKEWRLPLHLGAVAIEKGAFGSPSAKVTNLLYLYLYLPTPLLGQDMTQGQFLSGV